MDEHRVVGSTSPETGDAEIDQTSLPYVGRWNQLVSDTNWEKGRIICQWREALIEAGAPVTEYSDEAWSRRVGGVTSQHVGRLRRVFQRFGAVCHQYEGLYWSHFQSGLDWNDAEMWLEGAVQNKWSVAQMRRTRWEALGSGPEPHDQDIVVSELDEDFVATAADDVGDAHEATSRTIRPELGEAHGGPRHEGPDFGDEPGGESAGDDGHDVIADDEPIDEFRPFEHLAELPDDLAEAFESFKLAIIRHRSENWKQISLEDVLASLDALKLLAAR